MFARRHPILFFCLALAALLTVGFIAGVGIITLGFRGIASLGSENWQQKNGNIGIVEVSGPILSSGQVIKDLEDFRKNRAIKAIVLRIDSPGGGIVPSQEIYREILKIGKQKLIVASMGSVAASGGYYIASAAQAIMANPGTITGSIGVIMEYAEVSKIINNIGVIPIVIKSGEFKDMGSPLRKVTEKEQQMFQELVNELHKQFVTDAAAGRNMPFDQMSLLADGRVYTGQTALKLKLVDRLGNLDDAVQWTGELAKIKGPLVPVYPKKDKMDGILKQLTQTLLQGFNLSGTMANNLGFIIK